MDSSIETLTSSSVFYPAGTAPGLTANTTSLAITATTADTADGTAGDVVFSLDATTNTLQYLGNSGLPTDANIWYDLSGDVNNLVKFNDIAVSQIIDPSVVDVTVRVIPGATASGGTGTLYFQSNDTSGGRSDIVSVTVTITDRPTMQYMVKVDMVF
jgi:hypothetical protein